MPRTFRQTNHDTQSQIFVLHFKTLPKIIKKKKKNKFLSLLVPFCASDYMFSPPPPDPYMRIACMHMTESVSFISCLINNTVLCHSTLLCANFTPVCAPLRYFTPLYAALRYFTVFRQTRLHYIDCDVNSNTRRLYSQW